MRASGIRPPFEGLSQSSGQVPHVLLTRSPLGLPQCCHWLDLVRLACFKHAASVRPEPGSNSPSKISSIEIELAPSGGASTTRILTVRLRQQRPPRKQASGAVARTRSLVLSSVFKERLALRTRALTRALVPALLAPPAPEGPCGARSQSNDLPEGRQPAGQLSEIFLGEAL